MPGKTEISQLTVEPWAFEPNRIAPGWRIGDVLILSGQVAVDSNMDVVGAGDFDAQAVQVLENIQTILEANGSKLDNIIKVTIYLTDIAHLSSIVELRAKYFTPPYPASTMIEVSALAFPELMIEIEAIAVTDAAMSGA